LVSLGTLLAVVVVTIFRPESDNTVLIGLIFASAVPTTTGLLSFIKSTQNSAELAAAQEKLNAANTAIAKTDSKVQNLAITVDGRLTQLLAVTEGKALAEGVAKGVQDERDRVAASGTVTGLTPPHGTPIVKLPSEGDE